MNKKYSLSVPDPTMFGMKLSGVNPKKNPFLVEGEVLLKIDRIGIVQYTIVETDFPQSFPKGEIFWSSTSVLFCTAINPNLLTAINSDFWNLESNSFRQDTNYVIFSKHKTDNFHWRIIIYSPNELCFQPHAERLINEGLDKVSFDIR
ncbi:hypothetical protein [Paenibacillus silvae]|uniref:Uncharacterized protein n=1 Tax=Paenibacillus silvae TaxID=1325358 RepID=A0A2W6QJT8_9BACL|nr:hypothetical protein [Paenibacillus silvae]PZT57433.1 hypothetical protein DN757_01910 [Paenibacillus silvae]